MSTGNVRWDTVRRDRAVRTASSASVGICAGHVHHRVVLGDVGVQALKMDLLLVAGPEQAGPVFRHRVRPPPPLLVMNIGP